MALFIISAVWDMGYSADSIKIQEFSFTDTESFEAIYAEKEFDGGKPINQSQNIIVTKMGQSEKTIIIAAHYDSVGTHGANDNGSGVSVALENAMRIVEEPTPYTICYIFFGAEEMAGLGSRHYLKSLSATEKSNILFVVNIDSIIGGDTCFMYGGAIQNDGKVTNDWAVLKAYELVQGLGLNIQLPGKENPYLPFPVGTLAGDHAPFMEADIAYIQFDGIDWSNETAIESKELGLIMHYTFDDLDYLNMKFPNRAYEALKSYSVLLRHLVEIPNY